MSALAGPVFALAMLLGFAGVQKLAWPTSTTAAMRSAGLPSSDLLGRLVGGSEIVGAALAIAFGNPLSAALLALLYAAFTGFSWRLVASPGSASCGCFGQTEAPATHLHVALNAIATVVCAAAVIWPTGAVIDVLAHQPLAGVPFLALTSVAAWLWYLMLEVVPDLQAAMGLHHETVDAS
jgi:uncharacterized membrane protein YphA (DoxX/SURF4 family)